MTDFSAVKMKINDRMIFSLRKHLPPPASTGQTMSAGDEIQRKLPEAKVTNTFTTLFALLAED